VGSWPGGPVAGVDGSQPGLCVWLRGCAAVSVWLPGCLTGSPRRSPAPARRCIARQRPPRASEQAGAASGGPTTAPQRPEVPQKDANRRLLIVASALVFLACCHGLWRGSEARHRLGPSFPAAGAAQAPHQAQPHVALLQLCGLTTSRSHHPPHRRIPTAELPPPRPTVRATGGSPPPVTHRPGHKTHRPTHHPFPPVFHSHRWEAPCDAVARRHGWDSPPYRRRRRKA
jgi:hypothetical protein